MTADNAPIYTRARYLPPTRLDATKISGSLLADGCMIGRGAVIENSVIGLRCDIGENVTIRNSVLMGNDYYTSLKNSGSKASNEWPPVRIGEGCFIESAIIDKNCCLGRNVRVQLPTNASNVNDAEHGPIVIRDGVIVVPKGTTLPDSWQLT